MKHPVATVQKTSGSRRKPEPKAPARSEAHARLCLA